MPRNTKTGTDDGPKVIQPSINTFDVLMNEDSLSDMYTDPIDSSDSDVSDSSQESESENERSRAGGSDSGRSGGSRSNSSRSSDRRSIDSDGFTTVQSRRNNRNTHNNRTPNLNRERQISQAEHDAGWAQMTGKGRRAKYREPMVDLTVSDETEDYEIVDDSEGSEEGTDNDEVSDDTSSEEPVRTSKRSKEEESDSEDVSDESDSASDDVADDSDSEDDVSERSEPRTIDHYLHDGKSESVAQKYATKLGSSSHRSRYQFQRQYTPMENRYDSNYDQNRGNRRNGGNRNYRNNDGYGRENERPRYDRRDSRDQRDSRDRRDYRDQRDSRDGRDGRDNRDNRGYQNNRGNGGYQDRRNFRDQKNRHEQQEDTTEYDDATYHTEGTECKGDGLSLNTPWSTWIHASDSRDWSLSSYESGPRIESVGQMLRALYDFESLNKREFQYFVMRNEIAPIWEDKNNKDGVITSIKINLGNRDTSQDVGAMAFKVICMLILNESFVKNNSDITGVCYSIKNNSPLIKVWVKDRSRNMRFEQELPMDLLRQIENIIESNRRYSNYRTSHRPISVMTKPIEPDE